MPAPTWDEIVERMDRRGIPKLQPASPDGFPEPPQLFFDVTAWAWVGRIELQITKRRVKAEHWLLKQKPNGCWVRLRVATKADNDRCDGALSAAAEEVAAA